VLIDQVCGNDGRPLIVVHDFDAAGFEILNALTSDSDVYTYRNVVEPIDAGLRLADARRYGLLDRAEELDLTVRRNGKTTPNRKVLQVAMEQLTAEENEYLMSGQRIELNAFRPQQFLDWLGEKIEGSGVQKVIPPDAILDEQYRSAQAASIRAELMVEVERQVAERMHGYPSPDGLRQAVMDEFARDTTLSWQSAITEIHSNAK
jgi:hypothetical protein